MANKTIIKPKSISLDTGDYNFFGACGNFDEKELNRFAESIARINHKFGIITKQIHKKIKDRFHAAYLQDIMDIFITRYENDIFRSSNGKKELEKEFDSLDNFFTRLNNLLAVPNNRFYAAICQQYTCFNANHKKQAKQMLKLNPNAHEANLRFIWHCACLDKKTILSWLWQLPNATSITKAKTLVKETNKA